MHEFVAPPQAEKQKAFTVHVCAMGEAGAFKTDVRIWPIQSRCNGPVKRERGYVLWYEGQLLTDRCPPAHSAIGQLPFRPVLMTEEDEALINTVRERLTAPQRVRVTLDDL